MEMVKGEVPKAVLKQMESSKVENLESCSSSLLHSLSSSPLFHQVMFQLIDPNVTTCAKDVKVTTEHKVAGNKAFVEGKFDHALQCYCEALCQAPLGTGNDKVTAAIIYVNRATTLYKMGLMEAAERDCTRAINLDSSNIKAWYRRSCARAELEMFEASVKDMENAQSLETSGSRKNHMKEEIEKILAKSKKHKEKTGIPGKEPSREDESRMPNELEKVQSYEKGWGLHSKRDLDPGSVVLKEHPYAALISKQCRKKCCHFCFMDLPKDFVPCENCTIARYCSEMCKSSATEKEWAEHKHECGGSSWASVLPFEAVLAARIKMRSDFLPYSLDTASCNHFNDMPPCNKVDVLVLATTLAYCICASPKNQATSDLITKLVLLISHLKVNTMAVTTMSSLEASDGSDPLCTLEQVNVGHAFFLTGRLFNHSCDPNVHASFSSRVLTVRTIKPVVARQHLELCYGPQVGENSWIERQRLLKDGYFFTCRCFSCSRMTAPDLVIDGFRCERDGCAGVVLSGANFDSDGLVQSLRGLVSEISAEANGDSIVKKIAPRLMEKGQHIKSNASADQCLCCGRSLDTRKVSAVVKDKWKQLLRVEGSMDIVDKSGVLKDALNILCTLRTMLHSFNRLLAKAEDIAAKILCAVGEFQEALSHCHLSVQILKQLYGETHIAVANENLKMASVAVASGDWICAEKSFFQAHKILILHYGKDYFQMFPYIANLSKKIHTCN